MEKKIKDLGKLSDKILVFGGVYSNLQALEALYAKAEELQISAKNIICTGDLVAYCAQPVECVRFIKNWGINCIAGNVEINLANGIDDCGCNFEDGGRCDTHSKQWYQYLKQELSPDEINWMAGLPLYLRFMFDQKSIFVLHGSLENTSEFIFKSTPKKVKEAQFFSAKADVILAGHCGLPFKENINNKFWVNAGVIGMPANDGTKRVWYALIESFDNLNQAHLKPLDYNHELTANLMINKPLPQIYRQTLLTGLWDNCEILPAKETKMQGISIKEN